jgi:hypothetical protein
MHVQGKDLLTLHVTLTLQVKPTNLNRGNGITVLNRCEDILKYLASKVVCCLLQATQPVN